MLNPFSSLLYIFQSEHYDRIRFIRFVYSNLKWFSLSHRGRIEWTLRAKLIIFGAFVLLFIFIGIVLLYLSWFYSIVALVWGYFLFPIFLVLTDILISPLVAWKKNKILTKARILVDGQDLIIIGITGSYGKTTLKTLLESILSQKYNTMILPGNINTDLGIANYLLSHQSQIYDIDILIVEMGAYRPGEIARICSITPPDYSFLTAVAPVHLERFGSIENIEKAKFEIVEYTREKAFINIDNKIINNSHLKRNIKKKVSDISMKGESIEYTYLSNFKGIEFQYHKERYKTKLIAHHILGMIGMALELAKDLGLSTEEKQKGVEKIPHVPHRLEVTKNYQTQVTVIDDSYNGNEAGFLSALETLGRANGRKIVLTPGIVELGNMQKQVHERLAKEYIDRKIDRVLLIENSNTKYIEAVFKEKKFYDFKKYSTAQAAHQDLVNVLIAGDTILFQNDLTDNYN